MNLAHFSVHRPVATTMLVLCMVVLGAFAYRDIPLELFPRVDFPFVTIVTVYPGASPEEIENLITDPIEEAVSSISGIDTMTSDSLEGVSQVRLEFDYAIDQDTAATDVREKVDTILADLPRDADPPTILKLDINASAVLDLALFGDRTIGELSRLVDEELEASLAQVPGVAEVETVGDREREIHVLFDEDRLAAVGLDLLRVQQVLAQTSLELPGGRLVRSQREWTVRVTAKFASVADIEAIELPTPSHGMIRLTEVAEVRDTVEEERQRAYFNGQPAILLACKKRSDANGPATAAGLRERMEEIRPLLPEGVELAVVRDRSAFTLDSLDEVTSSLILGILLTAGILLAFLGSLRATFVAAVTMPASIVSTMLLIQTAGFTLDMLTMMALSITVGVLVNNAIVVLESITRRIDAGQDPETSAVEGTQEIAVAVAGSTLTNVVVFVPLGFMGGLIGQFFFSFGITAAFSTIVSLVIAFTLTPMLASRLLTASPPQTEGGGNWVDRLYRSWEGEYRRDLGRVLAHPLLVILAAVGLMAVPVLSSSHVGFEFLAEADQGEFLIKLRRPSGVSLESTASLVRVVEGMVRDETPEVLRIATRIGKIESMFGASEGVELGQLTVFLTHKSERARGVRAIVDGLRASLADLPGVQVSLEIPGLAGSSGPPLQVEILGNRLPDVVAAAGKVQAVVENVEGAADVDTTWRTGRPEIRIVPDRLRCERAGISFAQLAQSIRCRYAGLTPVTFREGADEFDVRLLMEGDQRRSQERIGDLTILLPSGVTVPIRSLARIEPALGPSSITRKERRKAVVITGYPKGRSFGEILSEIQAEVTALELPEGVQIRYMGDAKRMRETFEEISKAFLLAILLTYMLLAALLESFVLPVLILVSLPLAFVGILPALLICDMNIAMFPLMAVVMLVGIVVNNGILLVEVFRDLRQEGLSLEEAILEGAPRRLRPILMTTLAAALAMVPLALGSGAGGEVRAPMAVVSIGGLLASMVLSIYLIPLFYSLWERWRERGGPEWSPGLPGATLALGLALVPGSLPAAPPASPGNGAAALEQAFASLPEVPAELGQLLSDQEGSGKGLELQAAVAATLRRNDLLQAALYAVQAGREGEKEARGARFGELRASLSRVRYNDDLAIMMGREDATAQNLTFDLPLFTGGGLEAGERLARAQRELAEGSQEETRQRVVFQLVRAYYELLRQQWLEVVGEAHVRNLQLQQEVVQARVEAGVAVDSERLRVEVALARAREGLIRTRNSRSRAEAVLNLSMAAPVETHRLARVPRLPALAAESNDQAFRRARLHHPALRKARSGVKARAQALTAARAARKPSVGLNVTYGDVNPLFVGNTRSTQTILAAELPLARGGALRAKVRRAREELAEAREREEYQARQVRYQITQAALDLEEAEQRIRVGREAWTAARENARIVTEQYRNGAAIVLELVDAELSLLETRAALLTAVLDQAVARAAFQYASGDLWRFLPEVPR